jgi:predicted membrane channel-forming protein YqfA (hemolysin III family)
MKTESKFLLSLALLILIFSIFGITCACAHEVVDKYPMTFAIGLATAFATLFASALYHGFNVGKNA